MKKTFHTPTGPITRDLTQEEIIKFAEHGDKEAQKEVFKQDKAKAHNDKERIDAIEKYLGV